MKKIHIIMMLIILISITSVQSQVSINTDGSDAAASAMLDVVSTSKGMLVPRMSTTQRNEISNAANGLLVFDETTSSFWFYKTGTGWEELASGGSSVSEIDDLTDAASDGSSVFIGSNSGLNDDGSNSNTATGIGSLRANTTGNKNTVSGYDALRSNTSGANNTAMGAYALANNNLGHFNVAVGASSLTYNQEGSNNTAIGCQTGNGTGIQNVSGNIYLGYRAGYYETGNNKLYIENSWSSAPLIGGDFASDYVDINGDLNVNGSIKITGGSPGEDKVLTSDGSGNATWQTTGASETMAINDLTDAISDGNSVFLGNYSGDADDGTNNYNTGVGTSSLGSNTNGSFNSAFGFSALSNNTIGQGNIALGTHSLISNISGHYNIGIGHQALLNNEVGSNNTVIGYKAGYGNSGNDISGNIFIGYQAGYNEYGNNKLYIENSSSSSPLIGGDFSTNQVDINGTIKITGGNPGANKILTSDANGLASWEDGSSLVFSINNLTDANSDANNLFLGSGSGDHNTGQYNAASGIGSLDANTTGNNNSAFGYNTLFRNTSGTYNTAMGHQSSINNTIGTGNVSVGESTLAYNQEGSNNTALGSSAGRGIGGHNMSGNVFLGYCAGYSETGDNKLYIENSSSSTPLIGGDFSTNHVDINGTIKITGGYPGAGKYLTSDANGLASWQNGNPLSFNIDGLTDASSDNVSTIFIGEASGENDGGAGFNTGVGVTSLRNNDLGMSNVAIGSASLHDNIGGNFNVAIGNDALSNNTSGDDNTAVGEMTLFNNTSGSNNVALGRLAGYGNSSNTTSSRNIFIGYSAGYSETGNDKLYIESSNSTTPLIGGDFAADEVYINGTIKITGGTPGLNKVLTSDADGNATWENTGTPAAMSIDDLTNAMSDSRSVYLGNNSGNSNNGTNYNTALGAYSLYSNISGIRNTAIGYGSLYKNTASYNSSFGYYSMFSNTSGTYNSSLGYYALYKNTTGNYNSAFGYHALYDNVTGVNNSAFGYKALENNTKSGHVAVGYFSLSGNTTGLRNTAVGNFSLENNTEGHNNTAIGNDSGPNLTDLENTTAIGYQAIPTASNRIKIGNSTVSQIGGFEPWSDLSDKRFKNQIKENVAGLDFIMKLRPVTYHLDIIKLDQFLGVEEENPDMKSKRAKEAIQKTGFIAQEVEQAAKEIGYDFSGVGIPQNDKDHYVMSYSTFVVPLVKAVQEQQAQIEAQQAMIEQMQLELINLKKQSK